jgi:hypothetical protein
MIFNSTISTNPVSGFTLSILHFVNINIGTVVPHNDDGDVQKLSILRKFYKLMSPVWYHISKLLDALSFVSHIFFVLPLNLLQDA